MSKTVIRSRRRQVCIGSLDKKIIVRTRDMKAPVFGDTNYTEDFDRKVKEIWAAIKTVTGKVIFDGVSTDISISHEIFIRWDSGITSENGIELSDGRLLDIINVEDFEERQEFLRLMCSIRGDKTLEASHA